MGDSALEGTSGVKNITKFTVAMPTFTDINLFCVICGRW